ncbi:spore coat U domain-containing protein [Sphingomonas sp.]|jgi:spore coat protein U-like protein|uniref:Csu type fimbrial protein n=1 Tax=Sphingomonas sp. TaxID=28214 RepID=UPI0035C8011F
MRAFAKDALCRSIVAGLAMGIGTVAHAAEVTQASTVKLAVAGTCAVSSGGDLSFGTPAMTIDRSPLRFTANSDATSTILVTCSPQLPYQVYSAPSSYATGSGDSAQRRLRGYFSGGNIYSIPYNISSVSAGGTNYPTSTSSSAIISGTGTGAQQTLTYYGRIASGEEAQDSNGNRYATAEAGDYSDTLTFTVNY